MFFYGLISARVARIRCAPLASRHHEALPQKRVTSRILSALVTALFIGCAAVTFQAPGPATAPPVPGHPTNLLLALDGISYQQFLQARQRGMLRGFRPPVPLISTFPSLTSTAFSSMVQPVGYPPSPGYENRHYDWGRNKVGGGIPYLHFPWHDYFEIDPNTLSHKTLGYCWPRRLARADFREVERQALELDRGFITAYLSNTDAFAHLHGKSGALEVLRLLGEMVPKLKAAYQHRYKRPLYVTVLTDHGQSVVKQRPVTGLKRHLRLGGFVPGSSIKNDRSVVVVPFGYVSAGMLFLRHRFQRKLSRWLVRLDGIDLCTYRRDDGVIVIIGRNHREALIEARGTADGLELRYNDLQGDPLEYGEIRERLRKRGCLGPDGFAEAREWLEESAFASYPDALFRLYDAFHNKAIENTATVIFSTATGRAYGHPITRALSWLRAGKLDSTHGGLDSDGSLGAVITDNPVMPLPMAFRFDEILPFAERYGKPPDAKNWPAAPPETENYLATGASAQ